MQAPHRALAQGSRAGRRPITSDGKDQQELWLSGTEAARAPGVPLKGPVHSYSNAIAETQHQAALGTQGGHSEERDCLPSPQGVARVTDCQRMAATSVCTSPGRCSQRPGMPETLPVPSAALPTRLGVQLLFLMNGLSGLRLQTLKQAAGIRMPKPVNRRPHWAPPKPNVRSDRPQTLAPAAWPRQW